MHVLHVEIRKVKKEGLHDSHEETNTQDSTSVPDKARSVNLTYDTIGILENKLNLCVMLALPITLLLYSYR